MNETITLAEAILVSISTVLIWAFIKTVLEFIEEDAARRELPQQKFHKRSFKQYHKELWYGDESQDEITKMINEVHGTYWKNV